MKIDSSKISNKGDLMAIVCTLIILCLLAAAVFIAATMDSFFAGFFSATLIWNWHRWIYLPMDRLVDKLWAKEKNVALSKARMEKKIG
jgi:hypothetical protein